MNALASWLTEADRTQRSFAAELGVREATVSDWCTGTKLPNARHAVRIAEATRGAVPVESWFPKAGAA